MSIKNKFIAVALVALSIGVLPHLDFGFTSKISKLSTASVITTDFIKTVEEGQDINCDYQEEINTKFEGLNSDSSNYQVLYDANKLKYSTKKFEDCFIPEIKSFKRKAIKVNVSELNTAPIIESTKNISSQVKKIDSTYYEKAYGYVPEIPTPVKITD